MKLQELVGKHVYRTAPIKWMVPGTVMSPPTEMVDRSYMKILTGDEKRVCVDFVDGVAIIQTTDNILGERLTTIDVDYDDGNWMDATEVYEAVAEHYEKLKAQKYSQVPSEFGSCEEKESKELQPAQPICNTDADE